MENLFELFEQAKRKTRIIRRRKSYLYTFGPTRLPYIFAANSSVNVNDVVVRKGEIIAERPQIIIPGYTPIFEGFDVKEEELSSDDIKWVLLHRFIKFPVMKYKNERQELSVEEGPLEAVIAKYEKILDRDNDSRTALITGPEHIYSLCLLVYVGEMIISSAESNIHEILERRRLL